MRGVNTIDDLKFSIHHALHTKKNQKNVKVYRQFYFDNDYSDFVLKHSSLIILLHNSWTPGVFQKMNKQEFLNTNTTLANLFRKLGIAE